MQNLNLTASHSTPSVDFNTATGIFILKGRSIHENPSIFYEPLLEWLDGYIASPRPYTTLHIHLEYFNTSSSKHLLDVLKKVKTLTERGNSVRIIWQYEAEDEDIKEAGEDYSAIIGYPFEFLEKN